MTQLSGTSVFSQGVVNSWINEVLITLFQQADFRDRMQPAEFLQAGTNKRRPTLLPEYHGQPGAVDRERYAMHALRDIPTTAKPKRGANYFTEKYFWKLFKSSY